MSSRSRLCPMVASPIPSGPIPSGPVLIGPILIGVALSTACGPAPGAQHPVAKEPRQTGTVAVDGAPSQPGATVVSPEREAPSSGLDELGALEHDLEVSERRLEAQLALKRNAERAADEPQAPPEPRPDVEPRARPSAAPKPETARTELATVGSPCDVACRALKSIRFAATRICELTGEGHRRCSSAQSRAQRATQRVEGGGCGCVADPRKMSLHGAAPKLAMCRTVPARAVPAR